jgi:hypothetical protein
VQPCTIRIADGLHCNKACTTDTDNSNDPCGTVVVVVVLRGDDDVSTAAMTDTGDDDRMVGGWVEYWDVGLERNAKEEE